jgi:phosphate/sulfate permease
MSDLRLIACLLFATAAVSGFGAYAVVSLINRPHVEVELRREILERDEQMARYKRRANLIVRLCAQTNACMVNLKTGEIELKEEK